VTEESSKVLKVGQGGDFIMTAESRRRKRRSVRDNALHNQLK